MPKDHEDVPHLSQEAEGKGLGNGYPPWAHGDNVGDLERARRPGEEGHRKPDGCEHQDLKTCPAGQHHGERERPEYDAHGEDFEGHDEKLEQQ